MNEKPENDGKKNKKERVLCRGFGQNIDWGILTEKDHTPSNTPTAGRRRSSRGSRFQW